MPVVLKFQSTGSIPGNGDPVTMQGSSLTIGRGDENDLALPDPDRTLSKRHCVIEDHNGNVVVVDISTNGTFLNYGKLALGGTPTPLNNGDILSLGPYEIMVSILSEDTSDRIADPVQDDPVSHGQAGNAPSASDLLDAPGDGGDFLDDLLSGREGPVGPAGVNRDEPDEDGLLPPLGEDDPLIPADPDPYEGQGASFPGHSPSAQDHFQAPRSHSATPAIPDDWDDDLLSPAPDQGSLPDPDDPFAKPGPTGGSGGAAFIPDELDADDLGLAGPDTGSDTGAQTPEAAPAPQARAPQAPVATPEPAPPTQAPPEPAPPAAAGADDAAARAFLKALGADDVTITPEDLTPTLSRMGHVLRIMIEGMREILMTRTSIKSEFRIEQTMIQAGGNNPLKFSISAEQAVEAMVRPSAKGYLDATDAAAQALNDIKAHEVATITGMEAALKGILSRLDPAVLEEKISAGGGLSSVLKSRKARYWEIYEKMYAEISDQAENDFHELFSREFSRAYKEQLDKLK